MAKAKSAWGIDIGQCALKALKLSQVEGRIRVDAFDVIEHPTVLSDPEANRAQLIHQALEQFLARNRIAGTAAGVSVPGQSSFTRFVKLPPVEKSKIPDIVRFEADQQIPFPISEVIWRWQIFQEADSPDVEAGIFAVKQDDVARILGHFSDVSMHTDVVQIAPLALYNFMQFEELIDAEGATLLADVGADKTDIVVGEGGRIWTRTIQIGGNNFTESLVKAFKLSFSKAETLKRTAASTKYARQVFQVMRPVFADLVQEIKRSVGYYTSLHRGTKFNKIVGLGNGFRLPGLQKFLEQNLNIPVRTVELFNSLDVSPEVKTHTLNENIMGFGVAYGLAIQCLGQATISTNILPEEIARKRLWALKRPWFAAAAAALIATLGAATYRANMDNRALAEDQQIKQTRSIVGQTKNLVDKYRDLSDAGLTEQQQISSHFKMLGYRRFWPEVQAMIFQSIRAAAVDQGLLKTYAEALKKETDLQIRLEQAKNTDQDPQKIQALQKQLEQVEAQKALLEDTPRGSRRIVIVEKIETEYLPDTRGQDPIGLREVVTGREAITTGGGGGEAPSETKPTRGVRIKLTARTHISDRSTAFENIITPIKRKSMDIGRRQTSRPDGTFSVQGEPKWQPAGESMAERFDITRRGGVTVTEMKGPPDPLILNETTANDYRFTIGWIIRIESDGVEAPTEQDQRRQP